VVSGGLGGAELRRLALEVGNPYTGATLAELDAASADDALAATRRAAAHRPDLSPHERWRLLTDAAARLEERAEEFELSIVREAGTARRDARREVARAVALLRACGEEAKRLDGVVRRTDVTAGGAARLAVTTLEPVGLVCAITPFNRPLNQVVVKVAPAIAANCGVVLKPSERTPLTAIAFIELLRGCGLAPAALELVVGRPEDVGDALVTSPHVDMITFTGSVATGRAIARRAGMVRTTFELGDSSPLIVLADADIAAAARAAAAGAFASAGQSCRGVKRAIVDERVADAFVELLAERAAELRVGDPEDEATDVGTVIDEPAAREIERRVEDAVARGARLVCGGRREGAQVWPAVLDRVPPSAPLVARETFGPCAPVIRVGGLDDAIACANATEYGLQAGVFTASVEAAVRCGRELRAGTVVVNDGPQFDAPNLPFGGVKASGLGREGAHASIREMSVTKTLVL
jgi:putative phosphonoacetaldehyde dehydrogenase